MLLFAGSEEKIGKEIGPIIENCYNTYLSGSDKDLSSDDFYQAVCVTIGYVLSFKSHLATVTFLIRNAEFFLVILTAKLTKSTAVHSFGCQRLKQSISIYSTLSFGGRDRFSPDVYNIEARILLGTTKHKVKYGSFFHL